MMESVKYCEALMCGYVCGVGEEFLTQAGHGVSYMALVLASGAKYACNYSEA